MGPAKHVDPHDAALRPGDPAASGDELLAAGYQLVLKRAEAAPAFAGIFPAWGARAQPRAAAKKPAPKAAAKKAGVVLPPSAVGVDPSSRRSTRSAGAWSFTPDAHRCYGFYKAYSRSPAHGRNNGIPPSPARIYSTGTPTYAPPVAASEYPSPARARAARAAASPRKAPKAPRPTPAKEVP
eukprot:TRINITY_DN2822_c0_g1_i1.p2 TRINITY_DN2822_c0_g1~~TRINITY_DN2822_c0_g1_i1.p2  ORF type:complete len:199 (+),score=66.69 TRINITY_DN2822_c0_g1_i1:53-598(+)